MSYLKADCYFITGSLNVHDSHTFVAKFCQSNYALFPPKFLAENLTLPIFCAFRMAANHLLPSPQVSLL